ncbi:MAG: Cytochrome [Frankiales bacterium]|nr:Cytochrome [Frankiales bacterium]
MTTESQAGHTDVWPFPRDARCPVLPPPRLAELRDSSPLADVSLYDGTQCTMLTRFDDVRDLLMSGNVSSDGRKPGYPYISEASRANRGGRPTIDRLDAPEHDHQRFMLAADFTVKRVRQLRPFIDELVSDLLDDMQSRGGPIDLVKDFAEPIPAAVIAKMLDLPLSDADFFLDRVQRWMSDTNDPADIRQAMADISAYLENVIDERSTGDADDLISRLVRDQLVPGNLSREQLVLTLHLLITAGFDTTANTIALGTASLLQHGSAWRELAENPDDELVDTAVEEIIRYVSVAHNSVFRLTTGPVGIGGEEIPEGRAIIALTMAANHDPAKFEHPDDIDIRRDAREHLAFGKGMHQCLGQALARVELRSVFQALPRRFPNLRLAQDLSSLTFRSSIVYGVDSLPVTW